MKSSLYIPFGVYTAHENNSNDREMGRYPPELNGLGLQGQSPWEFLSGVDSPCLV
jgi:hypothetical protein